MIETWRWFGPDDTITLEKIKQAGAAGVTGVCYNFMPVVGWTRTNLNYQLSDKTYALRFEYSDFAAYDVYIMQRRGRSRLPGKFAGESQSPSGCHVRRTESLA